MHCIIPQNSGFCFGVSLAVASAYENAGKSAYMYGEVVHNPLVVHDLIAKGLPLVSTLSEIPAESRAKVLIRAHGVSKAVTDEAARLNLEIIDKTCPRVKKIHAIVYEASGRGLDIIVVGKPNHPEVEGIMGWCSTNVMILDSLSDAKAQLANASFAAKGVCMVSQTTHNAQKYEEIYDFCKGATPIEFHNTICDATANRQSEIRALAQHADAVVVVGGKKSSNVTKLYEIASEYCSVVFHVENEKELDIARIGKANVVVIASGASTPNENVETVVSALAHYCKQNNLPFAPKRR